MPDKKQVIYRECKQLFIRRFLNLLQSEECLKEAVKNRATVTSIDGEIEDFEYLINEGEVFDFKGNILEKRIEGEYWLVLGQNGSDVAIKMDIINQSLQNFLNDEQLKELSVRERIIIEAAITESLNTVKKSKRFIEFEDKNDIENLIGDLPKIIFKKYNHPSLKLSNPMCWNFPMDSHSKIENQSFFEYNSNTFSLDSRVARFPQDKLNDFEQSIVQLNAQIQKKPGKTSRKVAEATVELLLSLEELDEIYGNKELSKIEEIFREYEKTCKDAHAGSTILKLAGMVVITGLCYLVGVSLCTAGFALAGTVAAAWSGPGALASGAMGAYAGSMTGWTIATYASGAVLGLLGLAGSGYGFFNTPAVVKEARHVTEKGLNHFNPEEYLGGNL